jgi:hypothetical protein
MIIERLKSGVITVGPGAALSSKVRASGLSSRPRTVCRPSRRPGPLLGSWRVPSGRSSRSVERSPARGRCAAFVDPIADIAVLGSPDNSHADDYIALMGTAADPPHKRPSCGVWSPQ